MLINHSVALSALLLGPACLGVASASSERASEDLTHPSSSLRQTPRSASLGSQVQRRTIGSPSSPRHHRRTYDSHSYFSLHLDPRVYSTLESVQTSDLPSALGVEVLEQIGELEGEWLVRVPKTSGSTRRRTQEDDHVESQVLQTWKALKRRKTANNSCSRMATRDKSVDSHGLIDLRHLPVRQRSKRAYEPYIHSIGDGTPYLHSLALEPHELYPNTTHHPQFMGRQDPVAIDTTELTFVQTDPALGYKDPILPLQWHLVNTEMPEVELNVTHTWAHGVKGQGVKVVVIDDGLDMHSDDLAGNFFAEGSYDFNDHTELPEPRLPDDQHGTRCAGEIAAVPNDVCGVGVAPEAGIAGVRILSAPISDADESAALNYQYQLNDVFSCSWGPPDDGRAMEAPENLILKAFVNGVQKGRDGKGSVFVFAAGNGGGLDDQCNFDGYTNSIFSITVGAIDRKGLHPYYSEMCAAMMVVAPSSGSGDHIHTTDVGKDKCSDSHGGTSAAAPLVAGVVALALQVRPELTWRDVQYLLIQTSVFFNADDPDWEDTAIGKKFSYKYGYGRVDTGSFVEAAKTWELVKPQAWFDSPAIYLKDSNSDRGKRSEIPETRQDESNETIEDIIEEIEQELEGGAADSDVTDADSNTPSEAPEPIAKPPSGVLITEDGIRSTYEITEEMLKDLNFEALEHVTVRVWIEHARRGDVEVEITSPNGIKSVLARQRRFDAADTGFPGWKFMSMKHWGENPVGTWTILVRDRVNPEFTGRFQAWSLQLWGTTIDPALAKLWAPAINGQPDEEQVGSETTLAQKPKPTAHLPDDHGTAEGEASKPGLAEPTPAPGADTSEDAAAGGGSEDMDPTGIFPGFFNGLHTLASPKWMAAGGGVIVLAAAIGAGIFVWRARRRRQLFKDVANERGEYRPVGEDGEESVPLTSLKRHGSDYADEGHEDSETTGLRYHDDFLGDGEGDADESDHGDKSHGQHHQQEDLGLGLPGATTPSAPVSRREFSQSSLNSSSPTRQPERERDSGHPSTAASSSSSWQDASSD